MSALIPCKGRDVLRALARLFDLDWHLTIVGTATRDLAYARNLSTLAEQLGVAAQVRFAGAVADAPLDALWQGADLFALATNSEGYGIAVAEASAARPAGRRHLGRRRHAGARLHDHRLNRCGPRVG